MHKTGGQNGKKGGALSRRAAMLCQAPEFRLWLDRMRNAKYPIDIPDGTHTEEDARDFFLDACGIESRAELDHKPEAAAMFQKICKSYSRYQAR
ncbi:hypothetical protein [Spongiibacter marinus]|uniref:hypothetical protein n=1 Tax=Spongiibacter marinus TaxID=354246 RepID=UPI00196197C4|nr:hypothetical protein [Spongiibacter marinus]MBM7423845.1 hypothetical protein [Spongiibacter marinus]